MTRPFRLTMWEPKETQVLNAVLHALKVHPKVGHAWRVNTAAGKLVHGEAVSKYMEFGFTGCPDIHGYMKDGRALYCEVKRPSGKVTPEQEKFITDAKALGCVAFIARSVDDVFRELKQFADWA
jgi:hypothetical protein